MTQVSPKTQKAIRTAIERALTECKVLPPLEQFLQQYSSPGVSEQSVRRLRKQLGLKSFSDLAKHFGFSVSESLYSKLESKLKAAGFEPLLETPVYIEGTLYRYDASVIANNREVLVEVDGSSHFSLYPGIPRDNADRLAATQRRDEIKTRHCRTLNIPLLRVEYRDFCMMSPLQLAERIYTLASAVAPSCWSSPSRQALELLQHNLTLAQISQASGLSIMSLHRLKNRVPITHARAKQRLTQEAWQHRVDRIAHAVIEWPNYPSVRAFWKEHYPKERPLTNVSGHPWTGALSTRHAWRNLPAPLPHMIFEAIKARGFDPDSLPQERTKIPPTVLTAWTRDFEIGLDYERAGCPESIRAFCLQQNRCYQTTRWALMALGYLPIPSTQDRPWTQLGRILRRKEDPLYHSEYVKFKHAALNTEQSHESKEARHG